MAIRLASLKLLFVFVVLSTSPFAVCAISANQQIVVVVPSTSKVTTLSKSEVIDLFMGRFSETNKGQALVPLDYKAESELKGDFYQTLVNRSLRQVNSYWSRLLFSGRARAPIQVSSIDNLDDLFKDNQNYVAYVPMNAVSKEMKIVLVLE